MRQLVVQLREQALGLENRAESLRRSGSFYSDAEMSHRARLAANAADALLAASNALDTYLSEVERSVQRRQAPA